MKWCCLVTGRIPDQAADYGHDDHLIEIEPALDEHRAQGLHYMLVIQSADGSHQCGHCDAPYPFVAFEVDVFLLACAAHKEDGQNGQKHADPLIDVQSFSEQKQGADEDQNRSGRVDRSDDRKRQVLESEISADPGAQYDEGFEDYHQMSLCFAKRLNTR